MAAPHRRRGSPAVRRRSFGLLSIGAVLLLPLGASTACTKAEQRATDASPSRPSAGVGASSSGSGAPSASPSVAATLPSSFGGTCADLIPVSGVEDALGRPVVGQTAYVVGVREPNIGRVAYLNCRYGITTVVQKGKKVSSTKVEIGISLYSSAKQAGSRVAGTIEDYRSRGAAQSAAQVGDYQGTVLIGNGNPTLVVAAGNETVAISANATLLGPTPGKPLAGLALAVLKATNPTGADSSATDESGSATPTVS